MRGFCHRDGRFAQVYWAYADRTVEETIARVVAGQLQAMKEMIGDDVETLREIEALLCDPPDRTGRSCTHHAPARVSSRCMTTKPKLTYFDAPVSRGEECRLALHVAGVDFEDDRVKRADWPAVKAAAPYGAVPLFTLPGHAPIAHSTAILTLIGRQWGLHPTDNIEAARHEGMMAFVEEMRQHVGPTMGIKDEAAKKAAREAVATEYLPKWAAYAENQIGDGPFLAGASLNVADIKLYMGVRWFRTGVVDHIPASVFDAFPKLVRHHDAVANEPRIAAWRARF